MLINYKYFYDALVTKDHRSILRKLTNCKVRKSGLRKEKGIYISFDWTSCVEMARCEVLETYWIRTVDQIFVVVLAGVWSRGGN